MPIMKWGGCFFAAIDPGINATGFAIYRNSLEGIAKLVQYGAAVPPANLEDQHQRTAYVVDKIQGVLNPVGPAFCYVEQPPSTLYGQKSLGKDALIARAQSVFKTVAVCFSILTYLRLNTKCIPYPLFPSQWQLSKKQRQGLGTKEWSLGLGNAILEKDMNRPSNTLHTKQDENIADAVVMGKLAYFSNLVP
jgi:hypothetical protein